MIMAFSVASSLVVSDLHKQKVMKVSCEHHLIKGLFS